MSDAQQICDYFGRCLSEINSHIYEMSSKHPENSGMATTVVLAAVKGSVMYVVNVGDSRAYILRNGELTQLTEDHTLVNMLLKDGSITPEEAKNHPNRNTITRAIGAEAGLKPDFFRIEIADGDVVILCTDGLYSELDPATMVSIIENGGTMQETCRKLVDKANRLGGRDNITVVCLRF
jgi:protein phosphatase